MIVDVKAAVTAKPEWLCPCFVPVMSLFYQLVLPQERTACQGAQVGIYMLDKRSCWKKQPWSRVQVQGMKCKEKEAARTEGSQTLHAGAVTRGVCLLQPLGGTGGFVSPAVSIKDLLPLPTVLFNPNLWLVHAATFS